MLSHILRLFFIFSTHFDMLMLNTLPVYLCVYYFVCAFIISVAPTTLICCTLRGYFAHCIHISCICVSPGCIICCLSLEFVAWCVHSNFWIFCFSFNNMFSLHLKLRNFKYLLQLSKLYLSLANESKDNVATMSHVSSSVQVGIHMCLHYLTFFVRFSGSLSRNHETHEASLINVVQVLRSCPRRSSNLSSL